MGQTIVMSEEPQLSKSRLLQLVGRYWKVVLSVFVFGNLTIYAVLPIFFTDLYETTAELLVRVGRENAETPATVQRGEVVSQGVRTADINSEVQILSSRTLVESVVDRVGPDAFQAVTQKPNSWLGYPKYYLKLSARALKRQWSEVLIAAGLDKRITPREEAILRLSDGIKVEPVRDSDILTVKVRTPSPALCLVVMHTLLEAYMNRRMEIRRGSAGSDFFGTGLVQARKRLDGAQHVRAAVRARYNLTAPGEQRSLDLKELNTLESEIEESKAEVAKLTSQRESLVNSSNGMSDQVKKEEVEAKNPVLQTIQERITALRVERAKIASHYQPGSEPLKKIDEELDSLSASLARESATVTSSVTSETNPTKRELASEIERQTAQLAGLQNRIKALSVPAGALEKQLQEREEGIDQLESAEREYRLAEQDYLTYSKRFDEARMSDEFDSRRIANVSIAAPPETPIKPVYPKKMFLMELGMGVSLLLGFALAAFLEAIDDRIVDGSGVLALGTPYLGTVDVGEAA
jgi:uncharacterized protein involved in exopolysaccharide biosynthesis